MNLSCDKHAEDVVRFMSSEEDVRKDLNDPTSYLYQYFQCKYQVLKCYSFIGRWNCLLEIPPFDAVVLIDLWRKETPDLFKLLKEHEPVLYEKIVDRLSKLLF